MGKCNIDRILDEKETYGHEKLEMANWKKQLASQHKQYVLEKDLEGYALRI